MITHETDAVEVSSGETTIGGHELVIRPTPTGLYKIFSKGSGAAPKITEDTFTTLPLAKRAIAEYVRVNQSTFTKKKVHQAAIERRQRAYELKNGTLENGERPNE